LENIRQSGRTNRRRAISLRIPMVPSARRPASVIRQPGADIDRRHGTRSARCGLPADIGQIEIPQRSNLLPYRGVLSFRLDAREGPAEVDDATVSAHVATIVPGAHVIFIAARGRVGARRDRGIHGGLCRAGTAPQFTVRADEAVVTTIATIKQNRNLIEQPPAPYLI
jgi:hypothetical protein